MKYGDERDRITAPRLSRRQFLASGGQHAARLAAGVLLPDAGERLVESPLGTPPLSETEDPPDDAQP
jgi:hypothetical protein